MASTSGSYDGHSVVSAEVRRALARRLRSLLGLAVMAAAATLAVTLLAYDADQASFNSTGGQAHPLGVGGAVVADVMLQALGLAGALFVAVPLAWGWRLTRQRWRGSGWLKLACLPMAALALSAALAAVEVPVAWSLPAGAGGFTGDLILAQVGDLLAPWGAVARADMALGFAVLAVLLTIVCLGLSAAEWLGLSRATVSVAPPLWRALGFVGRRGLGLGRDMWGRRRGADRRGAARREPNFGDGVGDAAVDGPRVDLGQTKRAPTKRAATARRADPRRARQTTLDLGPGGAFQLPATDLLTPAETARGHVPDADALSANARMLETVLRDFGVQGEIVQVRHGPVVTLYELSPAPGTKSARVIGLADDIARSMSAVSVRVAVVPGRNAIGIELPNQGRETVFLRELLESGGFHAGGGKLAIALGKDIGGEAVYVDLARMPHLLIAGTTGSGKSVAVNTMILSLLYRMTPEQCRFIMIDPKMLELSVYDGIPHLLSPVVTDPRKAIVALKWTVREMESRYRAMSKLGVRNIEGYNKRLAEARDKGEVLKRRVQTGFDSETGKPVHEDEALDLSPLPFIVVVIDEVADLMLVAGKDIEGAVQRLAQMARAAGIHVIMATQRPSVDVITGTIKANFPTRVSFQVTSKIDSRTILGEQGAEQLLGQGDMLYMAGGGRVTRVHGPFVSDEEVEDVVAHLKAQGEPEYNEAVTDEEEGAEGELSLPGGFGGESGGDDLYDRAVAIVAREGKASTSFVQRHLKIGYNRAASIIEQMEKNGVVGPANHVGKREILVGDHSADG